MAKGATRRSGDSNPSRARRISDGIAAGVILFAVVAAGGGAGWVSWREWLNVGAEQIAAEATISPATIDIAKVDRFIALCTPTCPYRVLLASGVTRLSVSRALNPGPERYRLLAEGHLLLAPLIQVASVRSEAAAWTAFGLSIDPRPNAAVRLPAAVARSYALLPFSHSWAIWRLRYCGAHWGEISAQARRAALQEFIWLEGIAPKTAGQVEDAFSAPAAALALDLARSHPVHASSD